MSVTIIGAIAGDTIGSLYEFNSTKNHDFPLFDKRMSFTDDSVMTVAVADWILHCKTLSPEALAEKMRLWGKKYPRAGYGGGFARWLRSPSMGPYNSWGNGSAMRVSPAGFAFDTLEETLTCARISAEVTHNHPEGIKGAQATAAAIFLARTKSTKQEIREYVSEQFGYDLSRTCDDIRPKYSFNESCQETVPEAIIAFLDSKDYEDAIRLAVSLGGDADTLAAITGGIAAAFYKHIPDSILEFVTAKLPDDLKSIVEEFSEKH